MSSKKEKKLQQTRQISQECACFGPRLYKSVTPHKLSSYPKQGLFEKLLHLTKIGEKYQL